MTAIRQLIAAWLLAASALAIGDQLNVQHYDTRDGIPQVQVLTVHQCRTGYIWLGSFSGLSRYDGREFRLFLTEDGLNANNINDVATGSEGELWVGTSAGLCRLAEPERFECLDLGTAGGIHVNALHAAEDRLWVGSDQGLFSVVMDDVKWHDLPGDSGSAVFSVVTDNSGDAWVGTDAGLYRKDSGSFREVGLPAGVEPVITALAAGDDAVWAGTERGLLRISAAGATEVLEPDWLAELDFSHLIKDRAGRLWGATASGLLRYEDGRFELLTESNRLASSIIHQVYMDREANVWLAHDGGLSKLRPSMFRGFDDDSGLPAAFVRTAAEDDHGNLWLGTRQGALRVPQENGQWRFDHAEKIGADEGLPDPRIYSIDFLPDGSVLLATSQGVVRWSTDNGVIEVLGEREGLPSNRTRALLLDSNHRVWISTNHGTAVWRDGGLRTVPAPELAAAYAMRIIEDHDGHVWFATIQHGLIRLKEDGEMQQWRAAQGLSDEMLWDLALSADGSVWAGSNGDGLFRVHQDGSVDRYTTSDGLVDDFVWNVIEDSRGDVWAYTNRGLSRFDGKDWRTYRERDGLLHLEGSATAAVETRDGTLWFGSADGLMKYTGEPEYLPRVRPTTVLREVALGDRQVEADEKLPFRAGSLRFRFAGLSFHDEAAVEFRYRLRDLEKSWTDAGTNRSVTYAGLRGGDYTFEVKARSPLGLWSESPAQFRFSVQPPFWATWWFWLVILIGFLGLTWSMIFLRERSARARQVELEQVVRQRTAELREANRRLEYASRTDPLTGLPNRRYLLDRIHQDQADVCRAFSDGRSPADRGMLFMMIDLDDFKSVNDRYGHDAGDQVLTERASLIIEQLREGDDLIRWGGEEFLLVARHVNADMGPSIAERILSATRNTPVRLAGTNTEISPTCSVGIASMPFDPDCPEALDWEQIVQLADLAVYQAKAAGRNRWVRLRPGPGLSVMDGSELIACARKDLDGLLARDELRLDGSDHPESGGWRE
ncbi:diguanylate cyclase [Wenzhouxiangella sp. AB-CW3]|uniref:ligand-binding sensor domain-containing diguanylate cyclase n=1 Tax=Wenzhouxiangella sp. AB-CW3 TaxID=2771012 RepID=UPI00168A4A34|nr:ligand-binding sensor domain-containing diguanylate cyclase [Wenzhouxiangella sp. AB-CW3]QOC21442.1 diguanylate cyclase [Wenzhouxiangella sp. AB-CW3]